MTKLSAIAAMSLNRVIGNHNKLPWHLPDDLKHFKQLTLGKVIIMGRKTFASIGKPLPSRTNVILTRQSDFQAPNCIVTDKLEEILNNTDEECFIIGGAEIYQQFLPKVTCLYLTLVDVTLTGDAFFPTLREEEWVEKERVFHAADEKHAYDFSFITLERSKGIYVAEDNESPSAQEFLDSQKGI